MPLRISLPTAIIPGPKKKKLFFAATSPLSKSIAQKPISSSERPPTQPHLFRSPGFLQTSGESSCTEVTPGICRHSQSAPISTSSPRPLINMVAPCPVRRPSRFSELTVSLGTVRLELILTDQ